MSDRLAPTTVTHNSTPTHTTTREDVEWAAAFLTRSNPDQSREQLERNIDQNVKGYTGGCGPDRPSWQYTARGLVFAPARAHRARQMERDTRPPRPPGGRMSDVQLMYLILAVALIAAASLWSR